jgi:chorismate synthase
MKRLRMLTAGESHGPELMVILDGMPAGVPLSSATINHELKRRQRGYGSGARMRIEEDQVVVTSGVMAGVTTGAPIGMRILNLDHVNWSGVEVPPFLIPRPGHADLSGALKYQFSDLRPALERASARETAARVAAGAVCKTFLNLLEISLGGWVSAIGGVCLPPEWGEELNLKEIFIRAEQSDVRCPDPEISRRMQEEIREAKIRRDTLGGILTAAVVGLPPGLGSFSQADQRLDSVLGGAVLSIPAVKGVEIGPAFQNSTRYGSQAQDPIRLEGRDLVRTTNRAGGLEGGVTNGKPLLVRAAMKPIATTYTPQQSVDLSLGHETETRYERSDNCPVPRAVPVLEAVIALVVADVLLEKTGGDSMSEITPRFKALPRPRLDDLDLNAEPRTWWLDD